jgi:hypothetical protein
MGFMVSSLEALEGVILTRADSKVSDFSNSLGLFSVQAFCSLRVKVCFCVLCFFSHVRVGSSSTGVKYLTCFFPVT